MVSGIDGNVDDVAGFATRAGFASGIGDESCAAARIELGYACNTVAGAPFGTRGRAGTPSQGGSHASSNTRTITRSGDACTATRE